MEASKTAGRHPAFGVARTRFGPVAVLVTPDGFRAVEFLDAGEAPEDRIGPTVLRGLSPGPLGWDDEERVAEAVENPEAAARLPLDLMGTAFQKEVWRMLAAVPPLSAATYGSIAAAVGRPHAARAVGAACAANRLAVFVPCHRVVNAAGECSGYRWGMERRRAILDWEASLAERRRSRGR